MNGHGGRAPTRRRLTGDVLGAAAASPLFAATLATACGGGQGAAQPASPSAVRGPVEFWHIWSSGPSKDWLTQALAGLREKAPQLQVQELAQDFWTFQQKVTTAATAGTPPDVTLADSGTSPLRGLSGENAALDARMSRDRVKLADLVDYQARETVYGGKTWGLPFRPDTRILFHNKSMLQGAGLDPAKPPATWDDLWSQSERLTKKGGDGKYSQLGFYPGLGNVWFWTMAWTNGAEFVDAKNVPTLNTRAHLETLEWFVRWAQRYDHGAIMDWNKELSASPESSPFYLEKLAFIVNTNPFEASLKRYAPNLSRGVALLPYRMRKASWGAGFDLELLAGGKNPDGAWELIRWLALDAEMNRKAIQLTSQLVALKATNEEAQFTKDPVWKTVVESLAITRNRPQVPEVPRWSAILNTHVNAAIEGKESPKDALEQAQAESMAEFEKNKQKVAQDLERLQRAR